MFSLIRFAAYHVRRSPFSPNEIGQYYNLFYLVKTARGFDLLVLIMNENSSSLKVQLDIRDHNNHVIAFFAE